VRAIKGQRVGWHTEERDGKSTGGDSTVSAPDESDKSGYDSFYREFDSPLLRQFRVDSYGVDIGQHSWVTVDELRADTARLHLSSSSRLLDLGCGPCGPLTFILSSIGCQGTGVEVSAAALSAGRRRATASGVDQFLTLAQADLNAPLPLERGSFDAAMSLDVVLHLRDRQAFFHEVARILAPGGRFLFTDAGVLTGSLSNSDVSRRSANGYTRFAAPGFNERALERAGLRLLETEDRTSSVLTAATGRLQASHAHREELERLLGVNEFRRHQEYLETVIEISRPSGEGLSRRMYLTQSPGG